MLVLLGALIAASVVAPLLIMRMGRPAFGILALVPGAGFVWTLVHFLRGTFSDGGAVERTVEWMPSANLSFDLRLDGLGDYLASSSWAWVRLSWCIAGAILTARAAA